MRRNKANPSEDKNTSSTTKKKRKNTCLTAYRVFSNMPEKGIQTIDFYNFNTSGLASDLDKAWKQGKVIRFTPEIKYYDNRNKKNPVSGFIIDNGKTYKLIRDTENKQAKITLALSYINLKEAIKKEFNLNEELEIPEHYTVNDAGIYGGIKFRVPRKNNVKRNTYETTREIIPNVLYAKVTYEEGETYDKEREIKVFDFTKPVKIKYSSNLETFLVENETFRDFFSDVLTKWSKGEIDPKSLRPSSNSR